MSGMAKIHMAALALATLTLLSTFMAGASGSVASAVILSAAAAKGTVLLHGYLGLDRAALGWRVTLVGFVLVTCAAAAGIHAASPYLQL